MSDATWMDEYLPVMPRPLTGIGAVRYSLQKWIGLRKENLARHNAGCARCVVYSNTCALCYLYLRRSVGCGDCPLNVLGNCCLNDNSPWHVYMDTDNPEPMIKALEEALAYMEEWYA